MAKATDQVMLKPKDSKPKKDELSIHTSNNHSCSQKTKRIMQVVFCGVTTDASYLMQLQFNRCLSLLEHVPSINLFLHK